MAKTEKLAKAGRAVTNWVFKRQKFCCCLPVRFGAGIMSFLTLLFAGLLAVILWFEVATNHFMSNGMKVAYVAAGIVETFLFIASIFGFIGVATRKQVFVVVYTSFLYFHLLLNLGIAIFLLWQVTHAANIDIVRACKEGIQNTQAQAQCTGLLNVTKGVYWGVAVLLLSTESYGALIATRYVNQLRYEKRNVRQSRMISRQSAYDSFHQRFSSPGSDGESLLMKDFNPYDDHSFPTTPGQQSDHVVFEAPTGAMPNAHAPEGSMESYAVDRKGGGRSEHDEPFSPPPDYEGRQAIPLPS